MNLDISKKKSRYFKKGLCGLVNLGNTCFMNTIIQCLNSNLDLADYFFDNEFKQHLNTNKIEHHLVREWVMLSSNLYKENCVSIPSSFHKTVQIIALKKGRDIFGGFNQNDSQEFLQFFLEMIHNSLSREVTMSISGEPKNKKDKMIKESYKNWIQFFNNDYSKIIDLFYGQFYSRITCKENKKYISETYEPFSNLSLEIPNKDNVSIYDCLDNFIQIEELEEHRQSDDDSNHYSKQLVLWSAPKYLIIFFKRYDNNLQINRTKINFPINNLDLRKYCIGIDRNKSIYDLHAVANHSGSLRGGHYWACTKNMDNNWYCFNDKFVTYQKKEDIVSTNVYCLFYKKIQ